LKPLGITLVMEVSAEMTGDYAAAGYGRDGKPTFWISGGKSGDSHIHLAFTATRAQVDAFYKAALAAGGKDNGGPGIRAHYHPSYYGAFVLDLDGNNIEAVCHAPA
jgi:hypothetical protein